MAKRDRAYFERRLRRDHPTIYRDLLDGKYASVREASIAAGLQKDRSTLQVMKSQWGKATTAEKADFLKWARGVTRTAPSSTAPMPLLDKDRKLLPAAAARIEHIQTVLGMKMGKLMALMGFKPLNAALGLALRTGSRVNLDLEAALKKLLADNAHL
ncbi:hypothetical protein ACFQI3_05120 [Hansschlegelia quercus]|uniref:Uncharacterized protein n=1 Tax=Hansschlegelia quercus TaxID=2528245 RepID=A0A4Q9GPT0_9HYPH|nr:hypothetical protein [Hansschlegelia quercus]TBN55245.1 hypothetical protein EYR15_03710 [Hansschlegelia quercus]